MAQKGELASAVGEVIKGRKAQIGVAVILNSQDTVLVNNACRYPMMSVFKLHQALAVVDSLQRNHLSLETEVLVKKEELKPDTYSPLRDRYPEGGVSLSVGELLKYTLQQSDNNACDILFARFGGPESTDRYIHSLGIEDFSIVATEDDMHRDLKLCYDNWSTPLATALLLEKLFTQDLFIGSYQTFLKQTLVECRTGRDRLAKALVDTGAVIGHKTGTGDCNEKGQLIGMNDVGFISLPDGRYYVLVVFVKDSEESAAVTTQCIADVSEVVYRYMTKK